MRLVTMSCPLCGLTDREDEVVFWEDENFFITRTKTLKRHRERIMLATKLHIDKLTFDKHAKGIWYGQHWLPNKIIEALEDVCKNVFAYTHKAVVMDGAYGTIRDHWHLVITDLEPDSDDFHQVLGTPWLHVINIKPWK